MRMNNVTTIYEYICFIKDIAHQKKKKKISINKICMNEQS